MSRTSGGRGLLVILVALVLLATVVDLLSPGSLIVGAWHRLNPPLTPKERAVETLEKFVAPRPQGSTRVEGRDSRGTILGAQSPTQA